jgi:hypothetical protein
MEIDHTGGVVMQNHSRVGKRDVGSTTAGHASAQRITDDAVRIRLTAQTSHQHDRQAKSHGRLLSTGITLPIDIVVTG